MPGLETPRQALGRRGEAVAERFFLARGFEVVARNWRCRAGELDLVVQREGRLHFIEVKARFSSRQHPFEAITPEKRERLERAIQEWFQAQPGHMQLPYQVDAFCFWKDPCEGVQVRWIEGM